MAGRMFYIETHQKRLGVLAAKHEHTFVQRASPFIVAIIILAWPGT
jgi:hypothetical protein